MSKHKRWATVQPIETKPIASPTFNTILDAKKAELSTAKPALDTAVIGTVKASTPSIKPKRDITAELAKIATRKASAKEKTTAPKPVKVKVDIKPKATAPAVTAKAKPKKASTIKPAKTVKAPVVKKTAPKVAPAKTATPKPKATKKKA